MSTVIVAADCPPWLVETFSRIDYTRLIVGIRAMFISQLRTFCRRYAQKSANYVAYGNELDIPQDVLDILNQIDYASIPLHEMTAMRTAIPNYLEQELSWAMKGR
jgi:hypothetical protein